jgi:hypothetical protein
MLKRNDDGDEAHECPAMLLHNDGDGRRCEIACSCGCKYKEESKYTKSLKGLI